MINNDTVASKLRLALEQIDALPPDSGVPSDHVTIVRATLTSYLEHLEKNHAPVLPAHFNRVSRLVVEYWPLALTAGDAVIAAEQAVRKLAGKSA